MGLMQILVIVGVIVAVVLVIIAIRGSFKSDDDFYSGSSLEDGRPTNDPASGHGRTDAGAGDVDSTGDSGNVDGGSPGPS